MTDPVTPVQEPCPICGIKRERDHRRVLSIFENERVNPARYTYGSLVDRPAVDAHLRAAGLIP